MNLDAAKSHSNHDALELMNVAVGKTASQSSMSQWSQPDEASRAVSGIFPGDFAFHTEEEENPFWQVDLGDEFPLEKIIIHNRIQVKQDRARNIRVEIAKTEDNWVLVHAGFAAFGAEGNGLPLQLDLGSEITGRFLKISIDGRQYLHLAQVEVFVRPEVVTLNKYCDHFGLPRFLAGATKSIYKIEANDGANKNEIVGVTINYSGRFGNLLHQYINVIQLAKKTGLKYVRLGNHELFDLKGSFTLDGLTLIPAHEPLPNDGIFLAGEFFNSDDFSPVLSPFLKFEPDDEVDITSIVQEYIVPHILTGLPVADEQQFEDELTIHIRAGDVFSLDHPMTSGYRQPPLSFYILVVERMVERGIRRVRLVFEDRGNPCVDALESWLAEKKIPCRIQCKSLHADMSALINAPHLVFGHGTFGYAACRLSSKIKTVHYFAPELGGCYGFIPTIEDVYEVFDAQGKYIKAYEYGKPFNMEEGWRNTPEKRDLMLKYPREALAIRELPRSFRHRI